MGTFDIVSSPPPPPGISAHGPGQNYHPREWYWPRCIKLTINGKLDFNGNFHRILDADWLRCLVAMVVTFESKVIINGKFHATEPCKFRSVRVNLLNIHYERSEVRSAAAKGVQA